MKSMRVLLLLILGILMSCNSQKQLTVKVTNPIAIKRESETIELKYSNIVQQFPGIPAEKIQIKNCDNVIIPSQKIDCDSDGQFDLLIFQTDLTPKEEKEFYIVVGEPQKFEKKTHARFVPEREDDFAWENDRIAYRMYGKKLSDKENVDSGVDVWVKSVDYLVIDKWYASEDYHDDHGEGLDFYKVGPSRGCGGMAIYSDSVIYGNGGFSAHKVIADGPIRSIFELKYEPVNIDGKIYTETRRISIDAGWNLNKVVSKIDAKDDFQVLVGVKIHPDQGEGAVIYGKEAGYLSFWEPGTEGNGEIGTGIVMLADQVNEVKELENHHSIISEIKAGDKFCYYSGAGWNKSKNFSDKTDWDNYVKNKALCINNPLKIEIK